MANPRRDANLWHASYVQTYLERDLRTIRHVGNLSQFQSFLTMLAARSAQLVNFNELSREIGVTLNTIKAWVSVLEASYQILVIRPYFANIGKRLVKTPKVYFLDTGTLCYLTRLKDPEHAASGPLGGAILETAVLSEIFKTFKHQGLEPHLYFWRTSAGSEVDIIVEVANGLVPIEVKLTSTPKPAMASSITSFQDLLKGKPRPGYLVHQGSLKLPLGKGVTTLPIYEV